MRALAAYLLKLGTFGFGGPIALVARMRDELVTRGDVSELELRCIRRRTGGYSATV